MANNLKGKQSSGNQPALPLDHLRTVATNHFSNGENSQMQKALEVGSYFLSGVMAVNFSQFLGAPLYLINEDWYNAWIALTKQSFGLLTTTLTQYWAPTLVRVSGDKSVRGQLVAMPNGGLLCSFPQRMVLIANHQIYTDWLYLWWIAYCNGMHGHIFIVLKESLRRIPVLGWGMRLSQFIFLKRNWEDDKPEMAKHFQKLNKLALPMWLLIFPEGTNLADSTRERSAAWAKKAGIKDLQHTLLPRSTGLRFSLQQMRQTVKYVYDCTIAYEGVPRGQYAQDIFTVKAAYFEGTPPKSVNMYWRRFALSTIPLDDPVAFEVWLRARWMEKDALIEAYYRHGRFPADRGAHKTPEGNIIRGAGHIETEIKSNYWYEFLQIFAPVGVLALVLYAFYNALPTTYTKALNRQNVMTRVGDIPQTQVNLQKQQLFNKPDSSVSTEEDSPFNKAMAMYTSVSRHPAVRNVVHLPELTAKGLKDEMIKHQGALDTILTQKNAIQDLQTKLPARRTLLETSPAAKQPTTQRKANTAKPSQTVSTAGKPGGLTLKSASVARPASQKALPAKSPAPKLPTTRAIVPNQTAKKLNSQKGLEPKGREQLSPAPKLQTKPKPTNMKPTSTAKATTK